ncbi:hypothetical protein AAMO2058_000738900 [Amorphochlora amoebiformis]
MSENADTKTSGEAVAYVTAVYAYERQHPDEISFRQGDRIKVLEKHQTGWWTGEIKGEDGQIRVGNFPSNFVQVDEEHTDSHRDNEGVQGARKTNKGAVVDEAAFSSAFVSTFRDRRLRMIIRISQTLSVIISFAVGADQDSYAEHSEFRALVGIGALVFVYVIAIIICYIFNVEARWSRFFCIGKNPFHFVEAALDTLFAVLLLSALIAAINRSQSLDNTTKAKIAGVFAFFAFLLLVANSIISWRLYKEPRVEPGAVELA